MTPISPSLSLEDQYRRTRLISYEHELEEFLDQQAQDSLIEPHNIDTALDRSVQRFDGWFRYCELS